MCHVCKDLRNVGEDPDAHKEQFIKENALDIYIVYTTALTLISKLPDSVPGNVASSLADAAIETVTEKYMEHAADVVLNKYKNETEKPIQPKHG